MTHRLNTDKTVAVATDYFWIPIDADTPRSVKLQLLPVSGVAQYGNWDGKNKFYTHWAPLPKLKKS